MYLYTHFMPLIFYFMSSLSIAAEHFEHSVKEYLTFE